MNAQTLSVSQYKKKNVTMASSNSIRNKSIFGEYSKDEDKITAALLQIIQICGPDLIRELFDEIGDNVDFSVNTQVVEEASRPDGELKSNFHVYIESKRKRFGSKHDKEQLIKHVELAKSKDASLVYITPDNDRPKAFDKYDNVYWTNWPTVIERLNNYNVLFNIELVAFLAGQFELLVNNLVDMNTSDDDAKDRVIILGGRYAENVALSYGFYACQPNRSFKEAGYMAFCYNKDISYYFPILEGPKQVDSLEGEEWISWKNDMFSQILPPMDKTPHTIFKLGSPEKVSIKHTQPNAFARKQRYTTIEKLKSAKTTDDLL